MYNSDMVVWS